MKSKLIINHYHFFFSRFSFWLRAYYFDAYSIGSLLLCETLDVGETISLQIQSIKLFKIL